MKYAVAFIFLIVGGCAPDVSQMKVLSDSGCVGWTQNRWERSTTYRIVVDTTVTTLPDTLIIVIPK